MPIKGVKGSMSDMGPGTDFSSVFSRLSVRDPCTSSSQHSTSQRHTWFQWWTLQDLYLYKFSSTPISVTRSPPPAVHIPYSPSTSSQPNYLGNHPPFVQNSGSFAIRWHCTLWRIFWCSIWYVSLTVHSWLNKLVFKQKTRPPGRRQVVNEWNISLVCCLSWGYISSQVRLTTGTNISYSAHLEYSNTCPGITSYRS
jgi:hypothetical protein